MSVETASGPRIGDKAGDMDNSALRERFAAFLRDDLSGLDFLAGGQSLTATERSQLKLLPGKGLVRLSTFFDHVFKYETSTIEEISDERQQQWMAKNALALYNLGTPARLVPHIKFEYISRGGIHMMMLVAPQSDTQFYQGYLYQMKQGIWEKVEHFGKVDPAFPTNNGISVYDLYNLITEFSNNQSNNPIEELLNKGYPRGADEQPSLLRSYIDIRNPTDSIRIEFFEYVENGAVQLEEKRTTNLDESFQTREIRDPFTGQLLFRLEIESEEGKIIKVARYFADGKLDKQYIDLGEKGYQVEEIEYVGQKQGQIRHIDYFSNDGKKTRHVDIYDIDRTVITPSKVDQYYEHSLNKGSQVEIIYDQQGKPKKEEAITEIAVDGERGKQEVIHEILEDGTLEVTKRRFNHKNQIFYEHVSKKKKGDNFYITSEYAEANYFYGPSGLIMRAEKGKLLRGGELVDKANIVIIERTLRMGLRRKLYITEQLPDGTIIPLGIETDDYQIGKIPNKKTLKSRSLVLFTEKKPRLNNLPFNSPAHGVLSQEVCGCQLTYAADGRWLGLKRLSDENLGDLSQEVMDFYFLSIGVKIPRGSSF